jgi:hypothetical protein
MRYISELFVMGLEVLCKIVRFISFKQQDFNNRPINFALRTKLDIFNGNLLGVLTTDYFIFYEQKHSNRN